MFVVYFWSEKREEIAECEEIRKCKQVGKKDLPKNPALIPEKEVFPKRAEQSDAESDKAQKAGTETSKGSKMGAGRSPKAETEIKGKKRRKPWEIKPKIENNWVLVTIPIV